MPASIKKNIYRLVNKPTNFAASLVVKTFNKLRRQPVYILYGIAVVLALYFAIKYLVTFVQEGMEVATKAEVLFFFADWCPHCTKAKPIVDDARAKYDGTTVNDIAITFKYVDCTDETQETRRLMEEYDIQGFPSIVVVKGSKRIPFESDVSADALDTFISNSM